jgi:hypothetical protein
VPARPIANRETGSPTPPPDRDPDPEAARRRPELVPDPAAGIRGAAPTSSPRERYPMPPQGRAPLEVARVWLAEARRLLEASRPRPPAPPAP